MNKQIILSAEALEDSHLHIKFMFGGYWTKIAQKWCPKITFTLYSSTSHYCPLDADTEPSDTTEYASKTVSYTQPSLQQTDK